MLTMKYLVILIFSLNLHAKIRHVILSEPTDSGLIKYSVLEVNEQLISDQKRISQKVIFRKTSRYETRKSLLKQAQKNPLPEISFIDRIGQPLWEPVKNNWSQQDEKNYSEWFQKNVTKEFNANSQLLADCADISLLFRWAYAHDFKLPVANTLAGTGKLFGHFSGSKAWDQLPTHPEWKKDERFKAALRYLFDNSYTQTVFSDLYPTEINSDFVHPGSLYMILRKKTGHAQTLFQIDSQQSGIKTIWGNEPSSEKIYESWIIWEPSVKNQFGLWRWPIFEKNIWSLTTADKMPGYSTEQFIQRQNLSENDFRNWVLDRLGLVDFDEAKLKRELQSMKEALTYRLSITLEGTLICGYQPCDSSSEDYDSYSTPSRDSRLIQSQVEMLKVIKKMGGINHPTVQKIIISASLNEILIEGYGLTYSDFIFSKNRLGLINANPNLKFAERWGLTTFENINSEFFNLFQVIKQGLDTRKNRVDNGYYACFVKVCDESSVYIKSLITTKMDLGLSFIFQRLNQIIIDKAFDQNSLSLALNYLRLQTLSYFENDIISSSCEKMTACRYYDGIWFDQKFNRFKTWKSLPKQALNSRWGL